MTLCTKRFLAHVSTYHTHNASCTGTMGGEEALRGGGGGGGGGVGGGGGGSSAVLSSKENLRL